MPALEAPRPLSARPWLDAAWRAAAYCAHPRVIGWSLAPLLLTALGSVALMWFAWEPMVAMVRAFIDDWRLAEVLLRWLDAHRAEQWRSVIANGLLIALLLPVVMAVALLLVAALMTPAMSLAGRACGLVTSTLGVTTTSETGTKSFTASYGIFG